MNLKSETMFWKLKVWLGLQLTLFNEFKNIAIEFKEIKKNDEATQWKKNYPQSIEQSRIFFFNFIYGWRLSNYQLPPILEGCSHLSWSLLVDNMAFQMRDRTTLFELSCFHEIYWYCLLHMVPLCHAFFWCSKLFEQG